MNDDALGPTYSIVAQPCRVCSYMADAITQVATGAAAAHEDPQVGITMCMCCGELSAVDLRTPFGPVIREATGAELRSFARYNGDLIRRLNELRQQIPDSTFE